MMLLFPDIVTECDNQIRKSIKTYPCHVNRASAIGDLCERKLVYERTHWMHKKTHDVGLEYIFQIGNQLETPIMRLIEDAGFTVTRQQEPFLLKSGNTVLLSGHIDGVLVDVDGNKYVLEINKRRGLQIICQALCNISSSADVWILVQANSSN